MKLIINFLILIFLTQTLYGQKTIHIIPPQSKFDSSHDYFKELLSLIIDETKETHSFKKIEFSNKMQQGRAFVSLKKNININLHWAGTSIEREKEFRAIKIPLVKGMLGYRFFIINKNKMEKFKKIDSIEDLKKLSACQGSHWPDTKILQNSGFTVKKNSQYEAMFLQVQANRCDFFPRGVHEIASEIEVRKIKYPELTIYNNLMIYYPFPMYFFVSKDNIELAKQIEEGLLKIIDNGKFDKFIRSHKITQHLFPIDKWIHTKSFKLDNPFMQKDEKFYNKKFWIGLE